MPKKNNPGCKCCGCTADASHVCICTCRSPTSRTWTIADALGSYNLTYQGILSTGSSSLGTITGPTWQSPLIAFGPVDTYGDSTGIPDCAPYDTETIHYRYYLCASCNSVWRLYLFTWWLDCAMSPYAGRHYYPESAGLAGNKIAFFRALVDADTAWTCDPSGGLSFSLPSTSSGLAVPGGGGTLLALPS